MAEENPRSLDRRMETLRDAADQGWRRMASRQAQALTRCGAELSKFGIGEQGAQALAGSLLKVAVDESGKYAEEMYRAGLDYYTAVISFYGDAPASIGETTGRTKRAKKSQQAARKAKTKASLQRAARESKRKGSVKSKNSPRAAARA